MATLHMERVRYRDRQDAGQRLAGALRGFASKRPVVLALPRGGVPVAAKVAAALGAPLDLVFVRKIGLPGNPEVAVAAIVDGDDPKVARNDEALRLLADPEAYLTAEATTKLAEIERRRALYLGGHARVDLAGRTVILIDDGIATGTTALAAIQAVRRKRPDRLVLAVPVAAASSLARLEAEVDEVVCLQTPTTFGGVGDYYDDFHQVSDEEVVAHLRQASGQAPALLDGESPGR